MVPCKISDFLLLIDSWHSRRIHVCPLICFHFMLFFVCVFILVEGGNPADMAALDGPDISSLSDNIDSTDDLVPSLQVS